MDNIENFQTVWKISGQNGRFPDSKENIVTKWKISGNSRLLFLHSVDFPDSLKNLHNLKNLSD